jgi:methylmalonyl-CoA/ethylmalonyl-CoA epimerase
MSSPIRRLDHIAIAVQDTGSALSYFRDQLGLTVVSSEENAAARARLTYLDAGNAFVQLVAPLAADAPIAAHLREHGEGLHHLCFGVEDVVAAAAELSAAAVGDVAIGSGRGKPSAFLQGKPANGTLIEVTALR